MSAIWSWVLFAGTVTASVVVVEVVRRLLAGRLAGKRPGVRAAARRCAHPALATAAVTGAHAALPSGLLSPALDRASRHALWLAVIGAATWLLLRIVYALTDPVIGRLNRIEGERNRRARRARTQLLLVRRISAAAVVVLAVGAALFTFPAVRAVGAGIMASAGVAGLVAGIAARPVLGNLFAGLQLAFSDALRLDDVVVVEGEWGRVEEMTLSYVVVRTWDERRLILPISYFAEQPFENWTRHTSRVVGSVILHLDWSVPVEELREVLAATLREHPLWDRRDWVLQVTEVLPNGLLQLRALMSAADAPSAWDLRCDVRERLVRYLREEHPAALPRFRTELSHGPATDDTDLDIGTRRARPGGTDVKIGEYRQKSGERPGGRLQETGGR